MPKLCSDIVDIIGYVASQLLLCSSLNLLAWFFLTPVIFSPARCVAFVKLPISTFSSSAKDLSHFLYFLRANQFIFNKIKKTKTKVQFAARLIQVIYITYIYQGMNLKDLSAKAVCFLIARLLQPHNCTAYEDTKKLDNYCIIKVLIHQYFRFKTPSGWYQGW